LPSGREPRLDSLSGIVLVPLRFHQLRAWLDLASRGTGPPPLSWSTSSHSVTSHPSDQDPAMSSSSDASPTASIVKPTADIGLVGLAVMGENLVLNMESHGFEVAVFNRTTAKVDAFLAGRARNKRIVGTHSVKELVAALKRPRKIMIMVKAGPPVDEVINEL